MKRATFGHTIRPMMPGHYTHPLTFHSILIYFRNKKTKHRNKFCFGRGRCSERIIWVLRNCLPHWGAQVLSLMSLVDGSFIMWTFWDSDGLESVIGCALISVSAGFCANLVALLACLISKLLTSAVLSWLSLSNLRFLLDSCWHICSHPALGCRQWHGAA